MFLQVKLKIFIFSYLIIFVLKRVSTSGCSLNVSMSFEACLPACRDIYAKPSERLCLETTGDIDLQCHTEHCLTARLNMSEIEFVYADNRKHKLGSKSCKYKIVMQK